MSNLPSFEGLTPTDFEIVVAQWLTGDEWPEVADVRQVAEHVIKEGPIKSVSQMMTELPIDESTEDDLVVVATQGKGGLVS